MGGLLGGQSVCWRPSQIIGGGGVGPPLPTPMIAQKDFIIWLKIKNDIYFFYDDVFICFAYIPPVSLKVL